MKLSSTQVRLHRTFLKLTSAVISLSYHSFSSAGRVYVPFFNVIATPIRVPESRHGGGQTQQFSAKFKTINGVFFCDEHDPNAIQHKLQVESPKSTVLKQLYFGASLLNFAPTAMVRNLVSWTIFCHCLFWIYSQSAAFIWHKTSTYSSYHSIYPKI